MITDIGVSETMIFNFTEELATKTTDSFMDKVKVLLIYKIATFIAKYWIPILAPVGLVGNTLSFLIMIKPSNRNMSTCIYMAAISINDNLMMLLFFRNWLVTTVQIHETYSEECKIESFVTMFSLQNATFQVVAMTLDKFIAIIWPHKSAVYSTTKRAIWTIIAVHLCVLIYNLPHLFLTKLIGENCVSYGAGGVYTQVYSWLTFILNGIVSFVCLIAMNLIIIHSVRKSHKRFNNQERVNVPQDQRSVTQIKQRQRRNTENQLTVMLLCVTTLFLLLLLPTYVRFLYFLYVKIDTPEKYATTTLFYHLTTRLYFTNSGINFFLYCISGRKFREDLKQLFCRNWKSKTNDNASSSSTAYSRRSETSASLRPDRTEF